jgi:glutathione synthase/RimK-type ligase-like ATP-grasp enzyme
VRIAVLIPDPSYPEPWRWAFDIEAQMLIARGASVDPVPWTEAGDLSGYDLVLPLVAWGYHLRYAEWLRLLDRFERERLPVINPPALLRWNSDKAYLAELGERGVATVPTLSVECCGDEDIEEARRHFQSDWLVIKPPVSASATGTFRLGRNDSMPDESRGRPMILQPLLEEVMTAGEFSLMLFGGAYSHCVVKRPGAGEFRVQEHLGGTTVACPPPPGGEQLARAALAAAPAMAAYARVDMIPDASGELMIIELELIEPSLWLQHAPDGGEAYARSILKGAACRSTRRSCG